MDSNQREYPDTYHTQGSVASSCIRNHPISMVPIEEDIASNADDDETQWQHLLIPDKHLLIPLNGFFSINTTSFF
jgi:hypothetical protein